MTASAWQAKRAATRAPALRVPQVGASVACTDCGHTRSAHSLLVLLAPCGMAGCGCPCYDPGCGCGHALDAHLWGTPPRRWECGSCGCREFSLVPPPVIANPLFVWPPAG